MHSGKDATGLLLGLLVGLACCGCADGPTRRPAEQAARPPARPQPHAKAPPLRITEPPARAQDAEPPQPAPLPQPQQPVKTTAAQVDPPLPAAAPVPELPATPGDKLRDLHRQAAAAYAGIDSYIVRLTRREQINGKARPPEIIRLKFRKQPQSVHLTWLEGDSKGREVVYVKGQYDNKLHTLLAGGDMPFAKAGSRIALAPDNPLVRSASRHSITEAGIGPMIERFGALVEASANPGPRAGTVIYRGPQKRPEFDAPVVCVEQVIPPGAEKDLPRGGRRWWMFDPTRHLPVLLITHDDKGQEVEYYCYDRFHHPVNLDDDDFNPDKLWGKR